MSYKNKYKNTKIKTNEGIFDSKLEFKHYNDLLLLKKAKKISNLIRQVNIKLSKNDKCKIKYRADFVYFDLESKEWVILDSKGYITDVFKLKKAWLLDNYYNFQFKILHKDKSIIEYPYNKNGIDFNVYINNYITKKWNFSKKHLTFNKKLYIIIYI